MKIELTSQVQQEFWLALVIGNSRLHWASFVDTQFQVAWDTPYLDADAIAQLISGQLDERTYTQLFSPAAQPFHLHELIASFPKLCLASVVPEQTQLWQGYPNLHCLTLEQVPLLGMYPSLGIDRALAIWGAGQHLGFPVLVIDAGTALTFSGADASKCLVGGAILPGLSTQLLALNQKTAQLPQLMPQQLQTLPDRWALNTSDAIASGVIYTLLSSIRDFVEDWLKRYPSSAIALTGGDADLILGWLGTQYPDLTKRIHFDPYLIFRGIQSCHIAA